MGQENLSKWAEELRVRSVAEWERLPEIELYMDQVVGYMEQQLRPVQPHDETKLLTASMVNNYVKESVLPRPNGKKYTREHMAMLMMICMMKPVLSISESKVLIDAIQAAYGLPDGYKKFASISDSVMQDMLAEVNTAGEQSKEARLDLALQCAAKANALKLAAAKLIKSFADEE